MHTELKKHKQLTTMTTTEQQIEFTRVNNDVNGNPRYVCHFLNLVKDSDFKLGTKRMTDNEVIQYLHNMSRTEYGYKLAVKRANKIGGRKYHTKAYGGGIVFQSYNIDDTRKRILELINEA